jgi:hypothetical protein
MTPESFKRHIREKIARNTERIETYKRNKQEEMEQIEIAFRQASNAPDDNYGIIAHWAYKGEERVQLWLGVKNDGTLALLRMDLKDESIIELDRMPWEEDRKPYLGL